MYAYNQPYALHIAVAVFIGRTQKCTVIIRPYTGIRFNCVILMTSEGNKRSKDSRFYGGADTGRSGRCSTR